MVGAKVILPSTSYLISYSEQKRFVAGCSHNASSLLNDSTLPGQPDICGP